MFLPWRYRAAVGHYEECEGQSDYSVGWEPQCGVEGRCEWGESFDIFCLKDVGGRKEDDSFDGKVQRKCEGGVGISVWMGCGATTHEKCGEICAER